MLLHLPRIPLGAELLKRPVLRATNTVNLEYFLEKHFSFQASADRWTLQMSESPNVLWSRALMQKVPLVHLVFLPAVWFTQSGPAEAGSFAWGDTEHLVPPFKANLTALTLLVLPLPLRTPDPIGMFYRLQRSGPAGPVNFSGFATWMPRVAMETDASLETFQVVWMGSVPVKHWGVSEALKASHHSSLCGCVRSVAQLLLIRAEKEDDWSIWHI